MFWCAVGLHYFHAEYGNEEYFFMLRMDKLKRNNKKEKSFEDTAK